GMKAMLAQEKPLFRRLVPLVALALLTGCANTAPPPGVLRVALQDDLKTLDPAIGYDVPSWSAEHLMYRSLVNYGFDNRIVPDLASSWRVEDGGTRYVFTLRPHLAFSDGKPLTSTDVVASLDRLLNPATKSPGASFYTEIVGGADCLAGRAHHASGLVANDPHTVSITLAHADPIFLQLLAMPFTAVLPAGTPTVAHAPIGEGPFKLAEWVPGVRMRFVRNPYASEPNHLRGVTYELGINETLEVLKFERGELDLLGVNRNIPAAEFGLMMEDPKYARRMVHAPDAAINYIGMNCRVAPFDKPLVREAIACAIDKKRLVTLVNNRGQVAQGMVPPPVPGFDPTLAGYPYDPARARALLAKAGFPHGFSNTYYCVSNDSAVKIAQAIQQDLAQVGINLTIKALAFPTFLDAKATAGRVGISSGNWSQDYPDPSDFLTTMFASKNIHATDSLNDTYYSNPQVDHWLDQAGAAADPAERAKYFRLAEKQIVQDAPVVPLYFPVKYQMASARVQGFRIHPIWAMALSGVSVK
ncbi:MAG TPA: ABC transporter substrate-binding protein, partial [Oscillatoriaceae cyanobacterium]